MKFIALVFAILALAACKKDESVIAESEAKTPTADMGRLGITLEQAEDLWGKQISAEQKDLVHPAESIHRFKNGPYYLTIQIWKGTIQQIRISRSMEKLTKEEILALCDKIGGKGGWPEQGVTRIRDDGKVIFHGAYSLFRFRSSDFEEAVTTADKSERKKEIENL